MNLSLTMMAEDDEALRISSSAISSGVEPTFRNNEGPFLDVHFGEQRLFGLVERMAPGEVVQLAREDEGDAGVLTVTHNVLFTLRLSSVPHQTLPLRAAPVDLFVNSMELVIAYAEQLRLGRTEELLHADEEAEFVRFKE